MNLEKNNHIFSLGVPEELLYEPTATRRPSHGTFATDNLSWHDIDSIFAAHVTIMSDAKSEIVGHKQEKLVILLYGRRHVIQYLLD